MKRLTAVFLVAILVLLSGCASDNSPNPGDIEPTGIWSFSESNNPVCMENGKPIIRLFSTTTCPHCKWVKNAFDSTVQQYVSEGKIVAYHWQLNTKDDTLTMGYETEVPASEYAVYQQFNPRGTVPTFVFGCKYYRVGNGYEAQDDLEAEIGEFKAVIEALLQE